MSLTFWFKSRSCLPYIFEFAIATMKFSAATTLHLLNILSLSCKFTLSHPVVAQDVFVPPVLTPTAGEMWIVGDRHIVTWNTSCPPDQITNRKGSIFLRKGEYTQLDQVLAEGFDILAGKIQVTTPVVPSGDDYRIVLFGDSGNFSPQFCISNPSK